MSKLFILALYASFLIGMIIFIVQFWKILLISFGMTYCFYKLAEWRKSRMDLR